MLKFTTHDNQPFVIFPKLGIVLQKDIAEGRPDYTVIVHYGARYVVHDPLEAVMQAFAGLEEAK